MSRIEPKAIQIAYVFSKTTAVNMTIFTFRIKEGYFSYKPYYKV